MGLVIQIMTKTYCCNKNKDRNIFNGNLVSEGSNNDTEEDEKLIVQSVSSFHTEINDQQYHLFFTLNTDINNMVN